MTAPFAASSVSLRLYPHLNGELDAPGIVAEITAQAALAAEAGFDGVMTSEHHGGFAGQNHCADGNRRWGDPLHERTEPSRAGTPPDQDSPR